MFRKNYFTFLLAIALFLTGSAAAFAQAGTARGTVQIKKADGSVVPVADAVIDIYRTDIKGKLPSAKTNKKGEFTILGMLPGARYVLAISAPGMRSDVAPGVKAGDEKIVVNAVEGDGKPFTEEEARKVVDKPATTANQTGELTKEQKKAQEDYQKQVAEVEKKNKNIEGINAITIRSLKEGNEQFNAKNYDVAIARFEEGINADPDYAGSASLLLNKKASALIERATAKSNATAKDAPEVRAQAMVAVKKDYEDALTALNRSLTLMKSSTETDAKTVKDFADIKNNNLEKRKETYRLMSRTGADRTKGKEALTAFQEYIDATPDAKVKAEAQIALITVLMDSQESDLAVAEAEKILAQNPNNVDALAVAGLSLVNVGYMSNDKAKLQQGANYLQKYTEVAPANHQYVADAKGLIESLKKEQNVAPQKGKKKN